jgi:3-oxoadipate enol-lactonase
MPILRCRDINVYYEIAGAGDPLLFIHGLGSSHRDWEPQVAFFSRHYQVITYDVRGHGKSDKPKGPYSVSQFAADAAELMRSLAIAPAHIVGLSMGGMIAFQLALDEPARVKSLVIANSAPELIIRTFEQRLEFWRRRIIVRLFGARKFAEIMGVRLLPSPEHEALRQALVERWAENDTRAYLQALKAIVGWSVAERIRAIRCPTLVITADQDYTPVSTKQAYMAHLLHAELVVIPDSRHLLPLERPEAFNAALMAFLRRSIYQTLPNGLGLAMP